ncbi:MAG: tripartite tricarboxylate transporter permease [Rhodospirillaceae bacterium]|jgi:putative tricarboxylic transport membrane protein
MGVLDQLMLGFEVALTPTNLIYSFAGALLGTIIGVLPGVGSAGALALLLPLIFKLDPVGSIIMLAAAYTGVMYGGSTASILLNVPGDTSAVVACLDGHQMAKKGRAGPALCIAAIGSYIAGTIAVVGLMLLAPFLADAALKFSSQEYFALYIFGLTAVAALAGKSLPKAMIAMLLGLMVATVGTDLMGARRFIFGISDLQEGIEFLAVPLGLFAVSEVLINARNIRSGGKFEVLKHKIYISLKELKESVGAIFRGGILGFFIGVLPGAGAGIAAFISYSVEVQVSKNPEKFGTGMIQGVAGPESANNAASAGAMVPMLALGIPGSATTAVMLGAFYIIDVQPGPLLFTQNADIVWGLIAALYLGNIMLLIFNLPMVGVFVRILYLPMRWLLPMIIVVAASGVLSKNGAILDVLFMCAFGAIGYYFRKYDYPLAPIILGAVLGDNMEIAFRQSMMMTQGDIWLIMSRPIVVTLFVMSALSLFLPGIIRRLTKRNLDVEEDV